MAPGPVRLVSGHFLQAAVDEVAPCLQRAVRIAIALARMQPAIGTPRARSANYAPARQTKGGMMITSSVRSDGVAARRRSTPTLLAGLLSLAAAAPALAQAPALPPVTVGAGVQTSFVDTSPSGGSSTQDFPLNSVRLYVNGSATNTITYMLNTEYDGAGNHITVLDAAAQFHMSDQFNIWAGRMLPPSDRANLYGPYYSNEWAVYTDGIQDGYPFVATGRDNGVLYWGQFDKVKISAGVYDGLSATGNKTLLSAGRVQVDLWDPEGGYYLNGTYYGAKNLLAIGLAGQVQGSNDSAWNADFLLEKKVPGGGAFTIESEYTNYSKLGGYDSHYLKSDGGYGLVSFLFPPAMGMTGKFEIMGKFAKANFSQGLTAINPNYSQKTSEFNFDYVIKDFNARVMLFYKNTSFSAVQQNFNQVGVGLQVQM
jgi:hypothetical protein